MSTGCIECEENVFEIEIQPERVEIIAECKQGPPGPPGPPGPGFFQFNTFGILPTQTIVIGSLDHTTYHGAKSMIIIEDNVNFLRKWQTLDFMHSVTSGTGWTIYGTFGDTLAYVLDVINTGPTLDIRLTNNDVVTLDAHVVVIPVKI